MACSCWAGGGSETWLPVVVVAAAAEMVEASPAVELTARQRRIIDGRRGSCDKDKDDDEEDANDVELDCAGALARSPETWDADGMAGAGALFAKEELGDASEMAAAGCLGGPAAMAGVVVEIAGRPPACQCHNRQ